MTNLSENLGRGAGRARQRVADLADPVLSIIGGLEFGFGALATLWFVVMLLLDGTEVFGQMLEYMRDSRHLPFWAEWFGSNGGSLLLIGPSLMIAGAMALWLTTRKSRFDHRAIQFARVMAPGLVVSPLAPQIVGQVFDWPSLTITVVWGSVTLAAALVAFAPRERRERPEASSPGPGRDHRVLLQGLHEPRHHRSVFISYSHQTRDIAIEWQRDLEARGFEVFRDETRLEPGAQLTPEIERAVRTADVVHVLWGAHSKNSEWVSRELQWAERALLEPETYVETSGPPRTRTDVVPVILDKTPLPPQLRDVLAFTHVDDRASPLLLGGLFVSAIVMTGLLVAFMRGAPHTLPLLVASAVGTAAGLGIALYQVLQTASAVLLIDRAYALARWLGEASLLEANRFGANVIDFIYGTDLWTWRAVMVSVALSTLVLFPLPMIWTEAMVSMLPSAGHAPWGIGAICAVLVLPMVLANVLIDHTSLWATRRILGWAGREGGTPTAVLWLWALDLVVLVLLGVANLSVSFGSLYFAWASQRLGTFLLAPWVSLWELAAGTLPVERVFQTFVTSSTILVTLMLFTAALPSLIHLLVSALALVVRSTPELLRRAVALLLRQSVIARGKHMTGLAYLAVMVLLVGSAGYRVVVPAPDPPIAETPSFLCVTATGEPLEMGTSRHLKEQRARVDSTWPVQSDDNLHEVVFTAPFALSRTELTQAQWAWVLSQAPDGGLRRQLDANPSTFLGGSRPVERVSWCDALRFANLWSQVDALQPAYRINGDPSLPECELPDTPVDFDSEASGYRLPTEAEWEIGTVFLTQGPAALRTGNKARLDHATGADPRSVESTDNVITNAWFATHEVCSRQPDPGELCDVYGNVSEWVFDAYDLDDPEYPEVPRHDPVFNENTGYRGIRGGSWGQPMSKLNHSFRGFAARRTAFEFIGFRLAISGCPILSDEAAEGRLVPTSTRSP